MSTDRIVDPEQVAEIIRTYLSGSLSGMDAARRAMLLAGSTDRILAGHQTRLVIAAYWTIRRLAESEATRPPDQELIHLLECIEGRRRFARQA